MFYRDGFFWGMHLIWWAIWLVALGWIFFAPSGTSGAEINEDDPVTTLKIRFAKGEISKEEYEQSRNLLRSDK
ncbi:SHOCT domain-containing protein [Muricauda sp. 334s03]|uniref:SHOCT domain-containing protein n=1 Tax=Flagellimonas yonaguniensis TaxID=3031325 RepID=A0ABT5XZK8_9FLAO|nr:SHOCT domain-containing protein [[Muricauda] yonaguniensis]MDF0716625.1 SHOCT domain-containing protein [[Muricauda] yonaguniensis]